MASTYNEDLSTEKKFKSKVMLFLMISVLLGIASIVVSTLFLFTSYKDFFLTNNSLKSLFYSLVITPVFFTSLSIRFLNKLLSEFKLVSHDLNLASRQVADSSNELSRASNNLSRTSQEQASAIYSTSSLIKELSDVMSVMAKNADLSSQTAQEAFSLSQETSGAMENLSTAMTQILESTQRIESLVKIIEQVAEKTEVIDEIVFKTQLLSFNASVEAERAGEHGRGFAVVAQEVGNLAQMSGNAAREIAGIVKNSIKEAELVATDNKDRVDNGNKLVMETRSKMEGLQVSLLDILLAIKGFVSTTTQQNEGMQKMASTMQEINETTQSTASTAEETASSSTQLSGQAQHLFNLAHRLDSTAD